MRFDDVQIKIVFIDGDGYDIYKMEDREFDFSEVTIINIDIGKVISRSVLKIKSYNDAKKIPDMLIKLSRCIDIDYVKMIANLRNHLVDHASKYGTILHGLEDTITIVARNIKTEERIVIDGKDIDAMNYLFADSNDKGEIEIIWIYGLIEFVLDSQKIFSISNCEFYLEYFGFDALKNKVYDNLQLQYDIDFTKIRQIACTSDYIDKKNYGITDETYAFFNYKC